jgi:hypothetical protein
MTITQIWEKARVSSPYILELVECNMCERKIKNCDAYDKIGTMQGTSVLTGQHQSDRSGPGSTLNWAAPVRPMPQTYQVQPEHKAKRVCAIWSKVIRPRLQASLDHFAPFSQHKQYKIQFMHHNLAIESLNYYNMVQTHISTHTNVLKSTKMKF